MIKGILFTVFALLLVAAIALVVIMSIKLYRASEDNYDHKKNLSGPKALTTVSAVACLTVLGLLICIPGSFHQVDTGSVAVVRHLGKIEGYKTPGTYFNFYMTNSYETFDAKVQQDKITTMAYSKDGQTMELEVFLQYQIQTENVIEIATQYGNLDALQARIETQTIEKTKAVMSNDIAMNIIQNRATFSNSVSEAVRLALDENTPRKGTAADNNDYWYIADNGVLQNTGVPYDLKDTYEVKNGIWYIVDVSEGTSINTGIRYNSYYVNVRDVVLTNIDFTDEFEKSVEDKVIAEQEKQAAITRAEAELEVAKLEAQKKIEEARGNAEAQKILAKASAEAATYKIIELARTLGYTVNETYFYSVDGVETSYTTKQTETETCIYLGTQYVIDITSGPGAEKFKSLVEDYLQYLAYLEQWNGELPDVVAGDDAISIIVPNGN